MARVHSNVFLHGISGMLGGQLVVRRRPNGCIVLSAAPRRTNRPSTPAQAARRALFREAVRYTKVAQHESSYEKVAAERGRAPFNVAVADFLRNAVPAPRPLPEP